MGQLVIERIFETSEVADYIASRWLLKQYKKSKDFILQWLFRQVDLKIREPKHLRVWYFRINKKFRAKCYLDGNALKIYEIDDHQ